jgi:hypothetical protein
LRISPQSARRACAGDNDDGDCPNTATTANATTQSTMPKRLRTLERSSLTTAAAISAATAPESRERALHHRQMPEPHQHARNEHHDRHGNEYDRERRHRAAERATALVPYERSCMTAMTPACIGKWRNNPATPLRSSSRVYRPLAHEKGSMEYPPPNMNAPIFKNETNSCA